MRSRNPELEGPEGAGRGWPKQEGQRQMIAADHPQSSRLLRTNTGENWDEPAPAREESGQSMKPRVQVRAVKE